jgi:uncharacterized protein YkwD
MTKSLRSRAALGALAAFALAACSDSAVGPDNALSPSAAAAARGGKPKPAPSPTPAPDTTTPPATTYSVATCDGSTIALSSDEKATLDLHNQTRVANGLPTLCVDQTLTTAARGHSDEMLAYGYFSHNSYSGESFDQRLVRYGYTGWTALGENIAYGSGSYGAPDPIFNNWMNSTLHRANILNGSFRQVGIGVRLGTYQGYPGVNMYTVDFGTR